MSQNKRTSQCMLCGRIYFDRLVEICEHCGGRCWSWRSDQTYLMHRNTAGGDRAAISVVNRGSAT